jgi:hypothetical protein
MVEVNLKVDVNAVGGCFVLIILYLEYGSARIPSPLNDRLGGGDPLSLPFFPMNAVVFEVEDGVYFSVEPD